MECKVVDFHIHPFYEEKNNFCFYEDIVHSKEEFLDDMERAGIDYFCGSVIKRFVPSCFDEVAKLNEEAMQLKELYKGKYIPGIHIHPKYVEESVKEIEKYSKEGVKLLGELCPYLFGWSDLYTPEMDEIYKAADKCKMVVSFHSFVNGQLDSSVLKAVEKFPDLIFVAAHPRDKKLLDEHIDRLKKYDNYYLDLSGTGIARYGTVKRLVEKAGSEKILFGTDYPINNPKMYVEAVKYERITDNDLENIFFKNACRLLGIS